MDETRPWRHLELDFGVDKHVQDMFQASMDIRVGDGRLALSWTDRWMGSDSPCAIAPDLCQLVRPRVRKRRTVSEASIDKQWVLDITGLLTVQAIGQYLQLWPLVESVHLQPGTEDVINSICRGKANLESLGATESQVLRLACRPTPSLDSRPPPPAWSAGSSSVYAL